ncbi:unnamed protein product, partial [Effrenium voratum]
MTLLRQLLIRGLPPDFSFRGRPLLHRACESGDLPLVEMLFACGADLHARGGDEMSLPIEVAAWCGQRQILRLLLSNGSCFGRSLHLAAMAGQLEVAQALLAASCPPFVRVEGITALDLAIAACQTGIVTLLLQNPALLKANAGAEEKLSSQAIGRWGLQARSRRLHLAAKLGGPRGAILDALLDQGGEGKQKEWWAVLETEDGQSPLDVAALPARLQLRPSCTDIWSLLLRHWSDETLEPQVRALLEAKADPTKCAGAAGWTPLLLCAMADRRELCQLLLQFGADPFQAGPRGRTAMLWADWYNASGALALLKTEGRRERKDDREGLKRLQTASKDELAAPLVAPLAPEELPVAMGFPGRAFRALAASALPRQGEIWEPAPVSARVGGKMWFGEDVEQPEEPLQDILSKVDVGPVGEFGSMKSLVAAARLLVQAKIAGGSPAETAPGAFALFALTLLGAQQLVEGQPWADALLQSAACAWRELPAERSVVFRAVRLKGEDLSAYRRQLELLAERRPVSWPCLTYGTLDRRLAMAYLEDWEDAALVFKIYCLTARRIHEFSWLAGENEHPVLQESLIAPGTQFESRGIFELSDVTLRRRLSQIRAPRAARHEPQRRNLFEEG